MTSHARLRPLSLLAASMAAGCLASPGDGAGGECPLTEPRGSIAIEVFQSANWSGMQVVGTFQRSRDARDAIRCEHRTVGPCRVSRCSNVGVDFVNGEPTCSGANPGVLHVNRPDGASFRVEGGALITLQRPLTSGETLSLRTTGGAVPAFMTSVRVPQRVQVTAPEALLNGRGLRLGAGEGVTVSWAPTASRVALWARSSNGGESVTECVFDGAAGTGTIPAELLPDAVGHVGVWALEQTTLTAGAYPITVSARWAAGAPASFGPNE